MTSSAYDTRLIVLIRYSYDVIDQIFFKFVGIIICVHETLCVHIVVARTAPVRSRPLRDRSAAGVAPITAGRRESIESVEPGAVLGAFAWLNRALDPLLKRQMACVCGQTNEQDETSYHTMEVAGAFRDTGGPNRFINQ